MSSVIEDELASLKRSIPTLDPGIELITCVRHLVRIHIKRTEYKQLAACFQFPGNYPNSPVLVELKSKILSEKLLAGLTKMCDQEAAKNVGNAMILQLVNFLKRFIDENPLCICSEEISQVKKLLRDTDEIKLKQKSSQVVLKLREKEYHLTAKLIVPDDYPETQVSVEIGDNSFPNNLMVNCKFQAVEIARRCVEAPRLRKPKDPPFEKRPSLQPVAEYLVKDIIRAYPHENCPICSKPSLPHNSQDITNTIQDDYFVFRVYCRHLFHHICLDQYMKEPPFTGGKKCPTCGMRIFHENFKIPPELAEARWANKEARKRELAEVVEFLQ